MYYVALSALALVACTNDEVIDVNPGEAIDFAVTTGNVTRAETTTNTIDNFRVWAYQTTPETTEPTSGTTTPAKDQAFFFEEEVTRAKSGDSWSAWSYGYTYFWPSSSGTLSSLSFYSISPANTYNANMEGMKPAQTAISADKSFTYKVPAAIDGVPAGEDLLYAVNRVITKETYGGKVNVNFRHALSQIVFKVKNTNPNLKVEVNAIDIVRTLNFGTYTLPKATTSPLTTTDTPVKGSWSNQSLLSEDEQTSDADINYYGISKGGISKEVTNSAGETVEHLGDAVLTLEGVTAALSFEGVYGTGENQVSHTALFMMPQTLNASTITTATDGTKTMDLSSGTYFSINCRISQKINGVWTHQWGDATNMNAAGIPCQRVAIPACTPDGYTWEEGKKYVYTIVFGEGAGYDGEPDDDDDDDDDTNQDPVLVPIDFTVTVDDFQDGGNYNVDMGSGQTTVETTN